MAPTGQCGFDCYIGQPGEQKFAGTASFRPGQTEFVSLMHRNKDRRHLQVTLFFPLYQSVADVRVGLKSEACPAEPSPNDGEGRIIIYGSSITQGGCASRPGMAYPAQLGRSVNLKILNLGFSGNGKGEPEVARVIAGIERPAALLLDYEANCGGLTGFAMMAEVLLPELWRILSTEK